VVDEERNEIDAEERTAFDDSTAFDAINSPKALFRQRQPDFRMALPVVILIVVVAVVSALVLGGVIQGSEERSGPEPASTTQPTVLIVP